MCARQYRIGPFTLLPHRQLLEGETPVALGHKALELLSILAEAEGDLVTKDEIMAAVWPNVTVEENALQVQMSALRKALGGSADQLQTVRSLGYRLIHNGKGSAERAAPLPQGTVAVLPFVNLTGNPHLGFLGESIADELINRLSQVAALNVPSRTSSFAFKGHDGDVRQIARELGVAAIVEGSVRTSGETIRITAQLVDAATGFYRWSENYDHQFTNSLVLEDDLAGHITTVLIGLLVP